MTAVENRGFFMAIRPIPEFGDESKGQESRKGGRQCSGSLARRLSLRLGLVLLLRMNTANLLLLLMLDIHQLAAFEDDFDCGIDVNQASFQRHGVIGLAQDLLDFLGRLAFVQFRRRGRC